MKQCVSCGQTKALNEFHRNNNNRTDGRAGKCKPCASAYNKKWQAENPEKAKASWRKAEAKSRDLHRRRASKYGLTREQLDAMILAAEGRCELCGKETENLHVDHCHSSSKVRGMLCLKCNTGLGNFNDDPELMKKAIEWVSS